MPKNAEEAYVEAIDIVLGLQALGIPVTIKPSRSKDDSNTIAKYSGAERVDHEKWVNVTFRPRNPDQRKAINEAARHLGWLGIHFDTGGGWGQLDWELDWSFNYTGRPNSERETAKDIANDLIDKSNDQGPALLDEDEEDPDEC